MKTYAIILAAGKGTRFGANKINKTAVTIGEKSLIQRGIDKLPDTVKKIYIVVGHQKKTVIDSVSSKNVEFVAQDNQLGTAHAVFLAMSKMVKNKDLPDQILVASGDHLFMISENTLRNLIKININSSSSVTILTSKSRHPKELDNARIVREKGEIKQIIEKNDLDDKTKRIPEINTGTYVFKYSDLYNILKDKNYEDLSQIVITHELMRLDSISSYTAKYSEVGGGINTQVDLENYLKQQLSKTINTLNHKKSIHRFVELSVLLAILLVLIGKLLFGTNGDVNFLLIYGLVVTIIIWMTFIVAFMAYKDPFEVALARKNHSIVKKIAPMVSCMVAVHNEEENIGRCIDSMLRQNYPNKEIIVVNDASNDGTLKILKEYVLNHKIIVIDLKINVGKKKALGEAMTIAKGEIFAHTDSDSVWSSDALEKMVTIFQYDDNVGALSGHGRALNGDKNLITKIQDSWMEGQFSARKAFESVFNSVSCVSGPLAVFRKEAIYNYLPAWVNDRFLGQEFRFATDRTLTGLVLGSKSIGSKLKKKYAESPFVKEHNYPERNWKVLYCKAAKSWTIVPDTMGKFIKQQVRWKKSFIRNIFFTGSFYWKKPLPTALVYYFHIILVFMGPFVTFRHLVYLPLNGNIFSGILYLSGIIFVGFMFGIACKLEEQGSNRWIYRPLMSLMSTLVISWLIIYSGLTIRKMTWSRS